MNRIVYLLIFFIGVSIGVCLEESNQIKKYEENFERGFKDGENLIPLNFNTDDNTIETSGYLNGYLYGYPYIGNMTGIQKHTLLIDFDK